MLNILIMFNQNIQKLFNNTTNINVNTSVIFPKLNPLLSHNA